MSVEFYTLFPFVETYLPFQTQLASSARRAPELHPITDAVAAEVSEVRKAHAAYAAKLTVLVSTVEEQRALNL